MNTGRTGYADFSRPRTSFDTPRRTRVNSIGAWSLIALLAILPLPLASVDPIYWTIAGLVVGMIGAWTMGRAGENGKLWASARDMRVLLVLFTALLAYLVIQIVPIIPTTAINIDQVTLKFSQISVVPGQTILMVISVATLSATFLLMAQFAANDTRRDRMLFALLCIITGYGIYGVLALQTGDQILGLVKWAYAGSATGTFVNRNTFATFLALGSTIAAGLIAGQLQRRNERDPLDGKIQYNTSNIVVLSMFYLVLLGAILLTNSRMGLFVTLLGTAVVLTLTSRALGVMRAVVIPLIVGIVTLAGALVLFGSGTLERLQTVDGDSTVRSNLYSQVWDLIWQRPLTGFGGGTFEYAFELVRHAPVNVDLVWDRAHNTYLGLWSELGLVVGSIPIVIFAYIAARLLQASFRTTRNLSTHVIGIACIIIIAVHSLVDFSVEIFSVAMVFAAITGMAFGSLWRIERNERA